MEMFCIVVLQSFHVRIISADMQSRGLNLVITEWILFTLSHRWWKIFGLVYNNGNLF